jgi:O-antigen ligase
MSVSAGEAYPARQVGVSGFPALLFVGTFLYCWVSLSPFGDLSRLEGGSPALDQLMALGLAAIAMGFAASAGLGKELLRPRWMIVLAFAWLAATSLGAPEIGTALRRLFVAGLFCVNASLFLLLPRDRQHFAALLALCVGSVIALCYLGVIAMPGRAIHQASDVVEPQLAGDWRGLFDHKNIAAPAMVVLVFFSLYLAKRWSAAGGLLLAALAFVFLYQTNGKSALGLMPLSLMLAWLLEKRPGFGTVALLMVLIGFNLMTVGAAFEPAIRDFVAGLGIDATFTARADVWNLALTAILERPWTGYGFQSFWQTETLLASEAATETWAVNAAHAHNAYLDMLLDGGVIAFTLLVTWLVILPLRDIGRAYSRGADASLTRLYARIWVFGLLVACLESNFFTYIGPMWFSLLVAIFGLNLQGRVEAR